MLKSNTYQVKWCGMKGRSFSQKNGIKQGGGLSGIVFAVTYNEIIEECQNLGPSVSIKYRMKIAILVYADDIVLLSYSIHGIVRLYKTVLKWAEYDNDIKFNESKSQLIVRGTRSLSMAGKLENSAKATLLQCSLSIPYSKEANFRYLGVNMNSEQEAQARSRAIYAAANKCSGGTDFKVNQCSVGVRVYVFQTYIYSALYSLSCSQFVNQCLKNAYRYALFKFFGDIPQINTRDINNLNTRTSTLTVNAGVLSIGELHRKVCFSLYQRMSKSSNKLMNDYAQFAIYSSITFQF